MLRLRPLRSCQMQIRFQTTAATPGASGKERVNQIVEDISRLTLLETGDLIAQLKVHHICFRGTDRR
jgi:hypothetical protein